MPWFEEGVASWKVYQYIDPSRDTSCSRPSAAATQTTAVTLQDADRLSTMQSRAIILPDVALMGRDQAIWWTAHHILTRRCSTSYSNLTSTQWRSHYSPGIVECLNLEALPCESCLRRTHNVASPRSPSPPAMSSHFQKINMMTHHFAVLQYCKEGPKW